MISNLNPITIGLQISLNKRMYDQKLISYEKYSKANEILQKRLTECEKCCIINLNEKKLNC